MLLNASRVHESNIFKGLKYPIKLEPAQKPWRVERGSQYLITLRDEAKEKYMTGPLAYIGIYLSAYKTRATAWACFDYQNKKSYDRKLYGKLSTLIVNEGVIKGKGAEVQDALQSSISKSYFWVVVHWEIRSKSTVQNYPRVG